MSDSVTTRRGFVAGLAGSVFGLAVLWDEMGTIGGGGHSHGGDASSSPEEFRERVMAYVDRNRDGSGAVEPPLSVGSHSHDDDGSVFDHSHAPPVYLLATRWAFVPDRYRLSTHVPYEFRMMATDVTHGASIHLDGASRMHRLPPGRLVTDRIMFTESGEYPVYCSYYCGKGHNEMSATLEVV